MDVRMLTVGPVQENCFIARRDGAREALVVDPGDEAERIAELVDELDLAIQAILITHTHFDHVGAVAPLARHTGAPVWCPQIETRVLADIMSYVPWPGFGPFESYDADHTVAGAERLELAGFAALLLFVLLQIGIGPKVEIGAAIGLCAFAMLIYIPLGYATDRWVYNRRMRNQANQKAK